MILMYTHRVIIKYLSALLFLIALIFSLHFYDINAYTNEPDLLRNKLRELKQEDNFCNSSKDSVQKKSSIEHNTLNSYQRNNISNSIQSKNILQETNIENSLWFAERNKKVYKSKPLSICEDLDNWSIAGIGKMSITNDRSIEGKNSIRFKTSLRDEQLIKNNPGGSMMGSTQLTYNFDEPQNWSEFNRIAFWVYVHPSDVRVHTFYIRIEALNEPSSITDPKYATVIQHLTIGEWNQFFWEIPNLLRDSIKSLSVVKLLTGNSAKEDGNVCYDFDKIELQKVDTEKYEGWKVADNKISFSHIGYTPGQIKNAVGSTIKGTHFQLVDANSGKIVLTKEIQRETVSDKTYQVLDFSEVTQSGKYFLSTDGLSTKPFVISYDIWKSAIEKSLNFYYSERCGFDVPYVHPVCHNDLFGIHEGKKKQINGGWHDAGDLSQGSFRTSMSVYAMLDFINLLNSKEFNSSLKNQLIDEVLWGIEWLLKTRFGEGFRITWSGANIYTDGIQGNSDDYNKIAQNIPWENFIAAGTESYAHNVLKELEPKIAKECLQAAIEDWHAAVNLESDWLNTDTLHVSINEYIHKNEIISHRWFSGGLYLTLSWAVISSLNLYSATGDEIYADHAIKYGSLLIGCQEQALLDDIPFTGYFYSDKEKSSIVNHRHVGFEESPLIALSNLCMTFPNHEDWIRWYTAVTLHSEYYLKRGSEHTKPFNMIPASIYRRSDMMKVKNLDLRAKMLEQLYDGSRLSDEFYLRNFPIWTTRSHHGATAIQLSQTLALASAARLRNDPELERIVLKQMQWVLGSNPFSQSLMYGEGYDYQTLYSYNPGDIVGSLPVGLDCSKNDEPFWSMSNHATFKEVWIVPVSRFLWNAAYISLEAFVNGSVNGSNTKQVLFRNQMTGEEKIVEIKYNQEFQTSLPSGNYDVIYNNCKWNITVLSGKTYNLSLDDTKYLNFAVKLKKVRLNEKSIIIEISASGKGEHEFSFRLFNCLLTTSQNTIELDNNEKLLRNLDFKIIDSKKPWVIVVIFNGDYQWKKELTGNLLNK